MTGPCLKARDFMSSMFMKAGEVICIASGIYEGYDRTGPFVVTR